MVPVGWAGHGERGCTVCTNKFSSDIQPVRWLVSVRTYQPANSAFLSQQTSISQAYQPRNQPANRPIVRKQGALNVWIVVGLFSVIVCNGTFFLSEIDDYVSGGLFWSLQKSRKRKKSDNNATCMFRLACARWKGDEQDLLHMKPWSETPSRAAAVQGRKFLFSKFLFLCCIKYYAHNWAEGVLLRACLVHSQSLPQLRLGICQSSGMPTLRQKQGVWFTTMPNFRCGRFNSGNCLVHSHMSCHKFGKCMW